MQLGAEYDEQLVDLIYATVFGEARWQDFLTKLDLGLPGAKSGLLYHDARQASGAIDINSGLPADWTEDYARYYSKINPWMPYAAVRKVGLGVVAEQMLPRERFIKTEFYNDSYRKIGAESAVGITIDREDNRLFLLSTLTSSADADSNRQAADRLTRLAPHLRRAFRHFQAGYRDKVIAELGTTLFDEIDMGVIVVGFGGKPKSVSAVAVAVMERTEVARIGLTGIVKFADQRGNAALQAMLHPDYAGPRVVTYLTGGTRISMVKVQKDRQATYFEGPTIVVTLEHRDTLPVLNEAYLQSRFGITNSELRVLKAIYAGQSVREIADGEHRSPETIRAHLKSLYKKTDTSRQADLVRLAMHWAGR